MKHNLSNEELRAQMDEEARISESAAFDDDDGAPLPPHVKVSRPNRARSKVLQVRLSPEELEAVERVAASRGLPASTVARDQLLQMVAEAEASSDDVVAQLAAAADKIKMLVSTGLVVSSTGEHSA